MVVVVPGTSVIRGLPLHVIVTPHASNGLEERTAFQVEGVRAVSVARLIHWLGQADSEAAHAADEVLRNVLNLG